MSKHTPAPWGIEIAADGINKWVGCPRYSVATIAELPNKVNIGEADANARLIAAAPELLAVVERLLNDGLSTSIVKQAREAIARAKGGAA